MQLKDLKNILKKKYIGNKMTTNETNSLFSSIKECVNVQDIKILINNLKIEESHHLFYLLDVDDTLFRPKSKAFHYAPSCQMIDRLKAKLKTATALKEKEDIISTISQWRLQRQTELLDENWPQFIDTQTKKHTVLALTKMDTHMFGAISSVQEWRFNELKQFNIHFSMPTYLHENNEAVFYKGVILTGKLTKAHSLEVFWQTILDKAIDKNTKKPFVILVDDRYENLTELQQWCSTKSLPFLGIHYLQHPTVGTNADTSFNQDLAQFQEQWLLEHDEWLEDDIALLKFQSK